MRMAPSPEPRGLRVPLGWRVVIQESTAFRCQPNVFVVETLNNETPAVDVVPFISVTSIESGLAMTPAASPVVEIEYAPRPNVAATRMPAGCRSEISVIGLGGRPQLISVHCGVGKTFPPPPRLNVTNTPASVAT